MFYSVIVRFRAREDIYFNYYPSESLHGMLFYLLKKRDAEKVDFLHDEYESKPFTISPIIPYLKWRNGKKYLKKGDKHFFRITFLEDQWYKLFMEYFLYHRDELRLRGSKIEIIEVLTNSDEDKKCNSITPEKLRKESQTRQKIRIKIHSTTTFRDDDRHIVFPRVNYLFNSLYSKWEEFSEQDLIIEREDFNQIYVSRYDLKSAMEKFNEYPIKGFQGECEYEIDSKLSKEKVKDLNLLADFAFYSGVGYKTTMGLGQVAKVNK